MRKLIFIAVTFIVVIGIAFGLSTLSGQVSAAIGPYTIQTNFAVLALAVFLVALILSFLFFLLRAFWKSPKQVRHIFHQSRLLAEQKLTLRSLTALGSENEKDMTRYFKKLLSYEDSSEVSLFLAAQTAYTLQNQEEATRLFKKLAANPATRLLGLLGLIDMALHSQNYPTARLLITEAEGVTTNSPRLLAQKKLLAIETKDWKYALDLAVDKEEKAAFRIEAALSEKDPAEALSLAKQAYKLTPGSLSALLTYLNALVFDGRERAVIKIFKRAWQKQPQPELTDFLLAHAGSPPETVQIAKKIAKLNPDHPETHFLLAKAFFNAELWGEARRQIDLARQTGEENSRFLELFAQIAKAEGDLQAAKAAEEKAKTLPKTLQNRFCPHCHQACAAWQTHCPACGAFNFSPPAETHFTPGKVSSASQPSSPHSRL